jgi:hypothetical protein
MQIVAYSSLQLADLSEKLADRLLLNLRGVLVSEPLELLLLKLRSVQLLVVVVQLERVALFVQKLLLALDLLQ